MHQVVNLARWNKMIYVGAGVVMSNVYSGMGWRAEPHDG